MTDLLKLHIGCGKRYIPGFVHIDQVSFPHIDHLQDIRRLDSFEAKTASLIYACQVIEYFDREEVIEVLSEWRRVLAPGGILRVSVPNFKTMATLYQAGLPLEWFLGTLYGKIPDGEGGHIYHRTTYDEASLASVFVKAASSDRNLGLAPNRTCRCRRLFAGLFPTHGKGTRHSVELEHAGLLPGLRHAGKQAGLKRERRGIISRAFFFRRHQIELATDALANECVKIARRIGAQREITAHGELLRFVEAAPAVEHGALCGCGPIDRGKLRHHVDDDGQVRAGERFFRRCVEGEDRGQLRCVLSRDQRSQARTLRPSALSARASLTA